MYDLTIYSLKVGVCLAVFYLFFKLLLSRETFHRFNRFVVLGAMLLSFVLPLCVITVYRELPVGAMTAVEPQAAGQAAVEASTGDFGWETLVGAIFLLGAAATLLRTVCSLVGVLRLIRRCRCERLDDGAVLAIAPQAVTPFSWGRYIVISEADRAECGPAILAHERAHLRLHHSADLLATDLAACLQWFNPAMWLLRRELRAIHEYEADEAVLDSGADARSYQLLLIRKAAGGRWYSVANSFNHSKLKNRITMMLRKRSSRWAGARALLLLPLTGLALGAFAETSYRFPEDKGKKEIVNDTVEIRVISSDKASKKMLGQTLIVIDGREAASFDHLKPEQIASITVRKDSSVRATYGDRAKSGVIFVTTRKPGDPQPEGLKGRVVSISGLSGDDLRITMTDTARKVVVRGAAKPMDSVDNESKGICTIDMQPNDTPRVVEVRVVENLGKSDERVVTAAKKQAVAARKAVEEGLRSSAASIEAARISLEHARKLMDSDAWEEARKAVDRARKELEAIRKETASQESETGETPDESVGKAKKIATEGDPKSSVTVFSGRVSLNALPKGTLIYINGKRASRADVRALKPGRIRKMMVYKGDEAVKRFGEKGRKGVVEIRARR